MEKIILISLKLNFTPNILGCYGLNYLTVVVSVLKKYFTCDIVNNSRTMT